MFYDRGCFYLPRGEAFSVQCVCVLNPTRKQGRPPNQERSANKPPVQALSAARLLFSCGAHISKLELSVLRSLNCLPDTNFNVAQRLISDLFFSVLHIITDACS